MNKDRCIAKLQIYKDDIEICQIYDERIFQLLYDYKSWIKYRLRVYDRDNLMQLTKNAGIEDTESYVRVVKAIQATDTFWVKTRKDDVWDKVSPYRNRISRIVANLAINGYGKQQPVIRTPQPQYNINGQAEKCVKRLDGKTGIYLVKQSGELYWRETENVRPYSELCAQQVEWLLGFSNFTDYTVTEKQSIHGVKPYSICKLFTDESKQFIDFQDQAIRLNIAEILQQFKQRGLKKQHDTLSEMLFLDQLILNFDRHNHNIGYLYNPDNFKIIELAPIFDNDCGFGATEPVRGHTFEDAYDSIINTHQPRSGLWSFDQQAVIVANEQMYKKLRDIGHISLDFGGLKGPQKQRRDFMEYLVNRRRDEILTAIEKARGIKR